jgi:hypothetical protein
VDILEAAADRGAVEKAQAKLKKKPKPRPAR